MAKRMGVTEPALGLRPPTCSAASDVTVLDQSNGFATIANGGVHHDRPRSQRVEFPDGEVDEPEDPEGTRVVSDGVAYTVADVMKGTLEYGTAAGLGHRLPGRRQDRHDRGAGRRLVRRLHARTSRPRSGSATPTSASPLPGYGADLAAPIWHDYMTVAATEPCDDFPEPENPADALRLLQRAHGRPELRLEHDRRTTTTTDAPTTPRTSTADDDRRRRHDGYDPDLYAPGAGQEPAPTPGPGRAARRRRRRRRRPGPNRRRSSSERERRVRADRGDPRADRAVAGAARLGGARARQRRRRGDHGPRRARPRPASTRWSRASTSGSRRSARARSATRRSRWRSPTSRRWGPSRARPTCSSACPSDRGDAELLELADGLARGRGRARRRDRRRRRHPGARRCWSRSPSSAARPTPSGSSAARGARPGRPGRGHRRARRRGGRAAAARAPRARRARSTPTVAEALRRAPARARAAARRRAGAGGARGDGDDRPQRRARRRRRPPRGAPAGSALEIDLERAAGPGRRRARSRRRRAMDPLDLAAAGGEDYELLVDAARRSAFDAAARRGRGDRVEPDRDRRRGRSGGGGSAAAVATVRRRRVRPASLIGERQARPA